MGIRIRDTRALAVTSIAVFSVVAIAVVGAPLLSATAAPGLKAAGWAVFSVTPPTGTMTVAPGFPSATLVSDAPNLVTASGAVMSAATPPGVEYGSSSGGTYLSIRPQGGVVPSATTLTFASPTPAAHWSIVLGDVDAESVSISASGPGGTLTAAQLGFESVFNYSGQPAVVPARTTGTTTETVAGSGPDTDGASAWLSPSVPITSLTITSTRISGLAVVQFWIVGHVASLAGLVVDPAGVPVPGATVTVDDPAGAPLPGGSVVTTADAAGVFDIPGVFGVPVSVVATAADRSPGTPLAVIPTLDADGDPVFATAVSPDAGALLPVVVSPVVPAAPPAAAPELAATGFDALWMLAAAGLLVVAGVVVALVSRRRRPEPPRQNSR